MDEGPVEIELMSLTRGQAVSSALSRTRPYNCELEIVEQERDQVVS